MPLPDDDLNAVYEEGVKLHDDGLPSIACIKDNMQHNQIRLCGWLDAMTDRVALPAFVNKTLKGK